MGKCSDNKVYVHRGPLKHQNHPKHPKLPQHTISLFWGWVRVGEGAVGGGC